MTEYRHSARAEHAGAAFRRWAESDHEEMSGARRAAEALFAPKFQVPEPSTSATVGLSDQSSRKPRILSAAAVQATPSKRE